MRRHRAPAATKVLCGLAGFLALVAIGLFVLAAAESAVRTRSPAETPEPTASRAGDATPQRRAAPEAAAASDVADADPPVEEEEDEAEPFADEPVSTPAPLVDPRFVRIVDGSGAPLPGVLLAIPGRTWCRTGIDGQAQIEASDCVGPLTYFDGRVRRTVEPGVTPTVASAPDVPRLIVSVVDAATGGPLDPVPYAFAAGAYDELQSAGSTSIPGPAVGDSESGDDWFRVRVAPPPGYGGFADVVWGGEIAVRARRVRLTVPVFAATTRTFRVLLPDGRPASRAVVTGAFAVAAHDVDPWHTAVTWTADPADAEGIVRVAGLPRIPFARLSVAFAWKGEDGGRVRRRTRAVNGIDPCAPPPAEPIVAVLDGSGKYRDPSSAQPPPEPPPAIDGPVAPLAVRVVFRDSTPARRVEVVAFDRRVLTDADGRARFDALPVGALEVVAKAHGFLPTVVAAEVGAQESVEIRECEPRTVRVVVTDSEGHAVPSAAILARCASVPTPSGHRLDATCDVAQMDGETEILVPRTDRSGVVLLQLPRGRVRLVAALGNARDWRTAGDDDDIVEMRLTDPERQ